MQTLKLLIIVPLLALLFGAISSQAFVSANDAATEADCRWCHCLDVPSRHHVNKIISITDCIACHPVVLDPVTSSYNTQVQRDCTVSGCHGNVVGERHHLAIAIHPELGCSSCHTMKTDATGSLYPALSSTCSIVAAPVVPGVPNQPPIADAGGSRTVQAGQTAFFNGVNSYDPDSAIVDYTWDFGDGAAATGITTYHQFNNPGTYNVILRVTDDKGATTANTAVVTVSPYPVVLANLVLWLKNMADETVADSACKAQNVTQEFAASSKKQLFSISNTSNHDSAIAMRIPIESSTISSATIRLRVSSATSNIAPTILVYAYSPDFNSINKTASVAKIISYTGSPTDVDIDITSLLPLMNGMGQTKVRIVAADQTVIVTSGHFILK